MKKVNLDLVNLVFTTKPGGYLISYSRIKAKAAHER